MMFKLGSLFLVFVLVICESSSTVTPSTTDNVLTASTRAINMSINENMPIKNIVTVAREEKLPPKGVPSNRERNIGFADVFIRLENSKLTNIKITIQKIEIRSVSDNKLQDFSFTLQTIELKPLENSELAFHLTNKAGYAKQSKIKAILFYQFENKEYVIESDAVKIISH